MLSHIPSSNLSCAHLLIIQEIDLCPIGELVRASFVGKRLDEAAIRQIAQQFSTISEGTPG